MSANSKELFVTNVIRQVKFPFDRKEIAKELNSHIEELESYYLEKNMGNDDAQKLAVDEMGDSTEIGNALNNVHKPILGWLWITSKYLFIAFACFSILLTGLRTYSSWQESMKKTAPTMDARTILQRIGYEELDIAIVFDKTLNQSLKLGRNTILFERILLNQDGSLIILYQDLKKFEPFGLNTGDYPLGQLSTISAGSRPELKFEISDTTSIEGYKLLIAHYVGNEEKIFHFTLYDSLNIYQLTFKGE